MNTRTDALVIGAGPAGSATAILLARAGWQVVLVEQHPFPRRKVCGECLGVASLMLLDELGVGAGVRAHAGPELKRIGWMDRHGTVTADFPACSSSPHDYGRALRRDYLDELLVQRAGALDVRVLQPARVRSVQGVAGAFECEVVSIGSSAVARRIHAAVIVDAHGSWQRSPVHAGNAARASRRPHRRSDLFAFKSVFGNARLEAGLLPVLALPGAYGGMVIADQQLATLACCLRRDRLARCRREFPHVGAAEAVEAWLRRECSGVRDALAGARRLGPWLSVGPLSPGTCRGVTHAGVFRVGNAAGECHPLIGEGIGMALQSAALLAGELAPLSPAIAHTDALSDAQRRYQLRWRQLFSRRMRLASLYAHVAMRPALTRPARGLVRRWPALLTRAARLADKAKPGTTAKAWLRIHDEHA